MFPQSGPLVKLYGSIAVGLLISAGILALLTPRIKTIDGRGEVSKVATSQ